MANRHRGEVPFEIGGRKLALRLTLGGLAHLEDALAVGDLVGLGERLGTGRLSARDLIHILRIGLDGAGYALSDEQIRQFSLEGGLEPLIGAVAALFAVTFGTEEVPARPPEP